MNMRRFLLALGLVLSTITLGLVAAPDAGAAFPYPAPGAQATIGNRIIPGTSNSESCWATYSASAMVVNCYKYDQYTNPIGNWSGTYPIEYCNGAGWDSNGVLWVGNWYYDASPSYPYPGMSGRAPGCGLGYEQNGSQANARNYIAPQFCSGGGCTTYVGTLAGGSWWSQSGYRTQTACYLSTCTDGFSIVQLVHFT